MLDVRVRLHSLFEGLSAVFARDTLDHSHHERFKLSRCALQLIALGLVDTSQLTHNLVLQLDLLLGVSCEGVLEVANSHQLMPSQCPDEWQIEEFVYRFVEEDFVVKVEVEVLAIRTHRHKLLQEIVDKQKLDLHFRKYEITTWVRGWNHTISLDKLGLSQIFSLLRLLTLGSFVAQYQISDLFEYGLKKNGVVGIIHLDGHRIKFDLITEHLLDALVLNEKSDLGVFISQNKHEGCHQDQIGLVK
jgi:hypothetical protein